jgi:hypothetical protein
VVALRALSIGAVPFAGYTIAYAGQLGGRVSLPGLNPNAAGHAAALGVLALIGTGSLTAHRRWLLGVPVPLTLVYLAASRGGFLVLAVGLGAWLILGHRSAARAAAVALTGAAAVVLWGTASRFALGALLGGRSADYLSTDARTEVAVDAGRLLFRHPVLGVGYARFPDLSELALNTHDDWLRIAVEVGLPAVALLALLVAVPVAFKGERAVRALLLAGVVSWLFANVMADPRVALPVWLAAGLAWNKGLFTAPLAGPAMAVDLAGQERLE